MYYKPERKKATVDSVTTEYFKFGEGKKPFVMLPGLSLKKVTESAEAVASAYRAFGRDFTVYVFERKNDIEAGYSIENMADDTAKLMKHLGINEAYVFGTSQGGMIAQCLAADYPELVKKLLLASTSAKETEKSRPVFIDWIQLSRKGETEKLVESFIDMLYTDAFIARYKELLIRMFADTKPDELKRFNYLASACEGLDITAKAEKITCPTLVIGADRDKVFGVEDSELLKKLTGGEMYIYKDYCHAVYDEASDYKDRTAEFFKD